MERIFVEMLKKQLSKAVKKEFYVHIIDDTLVVEFINTGLLNFRYTLRNISNEIVHGLSSKIVANVIVKQYKKYILNQYFYDKKF